MRDVTSDEVIPHECVSGDDLCEFFPFIISIENGNVQYHSNHTGSAAIYSREISRERSRMTLLSHECEPTFDCKYGWLFVSQQFIQNLAENNGKKTHQ